MQNLPQRHVHLLLTAIVFSMSGDVFLMLDGQLPSSLFIPGLVSFLLAHVCYVALFKFDMPWFADRRALLLVAAIGAAMYVFLWTHGLPAALRLPVAAYVGVIALMAAQAWGRYRQLRSRAALLSALGASFFMLSDSILAINRFVQPLPWSSVSVLGSYYAAQALIVWGCARQWAEPASRQAPAQLQLKAT